MKSRSTPQRNCAPSELGIGSRMPRGSRLRTARSRGAGATNTRPRASPRAASSASNGAASPPSPASLSNEALTLALQEHHQVLTGSRAQREARLAEALASSSSGEQRNQPTSPTQTTQSPQPPPDGGLPLRYIVREEVPAALVSVREPLASVREPQRSLNRPAIEPTTWPGIVDGSSGTDNPPSSLTPHGPLPTIMPPSSPSEVVFCESRRADVDRDQSHHPSVPSRMRERITKGEFIDFEDLLPDNISCQATDNLEVQATTHDAQRQFTINLGRPRRRIMDFTSWLDAWTLYVAVLIDHSPLRASEFLVYQHIITSAMQQFATEAVLNYDRAVRSARSGMPWLRWDTINHNLWSIKLMRFPRPSCPRCGVHHSRDRCPVHQEGRPFLDQAGAGTATRQVCINFNRGRSLCQPDLPADPPVQYMR